MNIGIIGGGSIANFLLEEINMKTAGKLGVTSVYVRDKEKYEYLEEKYEVTLYTNMNEFLQSNIAIVVEAANVQAVRQLLPTIIKRKDVIVISIGAFVDEQFLQEIYSLAENSQRKIHLPSGAIGGLDLLQNAHALGEVEEVSITTRKPTISLTDKLLDGEKVIFSGPATDAIKRFPKNINVSIILSLAGIGTQKTKVTVIADPKTTKNEHAIQMKGKFGLASITVENNPMETNPNTSYLASLSVLSTLMRLSNRIQIG